LIVVADTSGLIAAADRNALDFAQCRRVLDDAGTVVVSPLVLAEFDHLAKARFGSSSRSTLVAALLAQVRAGRFQVPHTDADVLDAAQSIQRRHADLELDLADAVTVVVAAEYRTDAVLTLDRRDFRALRPLTPHTAFRVLPDDL
jgi:uncharacterized protein